MCCLWTCVSSLTDCAASGLVCSTTACAASGRVSLLWRPVLLLNVSLLCAFPGRVRVTVLQQSVMSSEVYGLPLHACASNARICSTAANAVPRGLWPTAACAPSILSVCKSLCCTWTCLFTRAFVLHLRVCLQELCASHGRVWLQEFCAAPGCVCLQELCAAPGRACLQEFLLHLYVSVYKNFVTHLDVSANKSAAQAVTVGVLLKIFLVCFGLFRNSSVCFGCFDIGLKHRNKQKYFCFLFHETNRNKRETDLVLVCFGSNRNLFLFVSRTP